MDMMAEGYANQRRQRLVFGRIAHKELVVVRVLQVITGGNDAKLQMAATAKCAGIMATTMFLDATAEGRCRAWRAMLPNLP